MTDHTAIREILDANAFFGGLSGEVNDFLADHARPRELQRDRVLFHYGDRATQFFLVISGRISVEVAAIQGAPLELQALGPGAVLGWSWLISPNQWNFQARAIEASEIIEFDGAAVLARCEADPAFGYEVLKRFSGLMSERLQFARQKMMEAWQMPGFA